MTRADYDRFDLLIGMDRSNLRTMQRICGGDPDGKLHLLLDFTDRKGEEVADPWYTAILMPCGRICWKGVRRC